MSFALPHRFILVTGAALALGAGLAGCGQKGPLTIPQTPVAAQRAALPQTIFGGGRAKASVAPASAAPASPPAMPPEPALPDTAEIQ